MLSVHLKIKLNLLFDANIRYYQLMNNWSAHRSMLHEYESRVMEGSNVK
jgi:hypothetical protein